MRDCRDYDDKFININMYKYVWLCVCICVHTFCLCFSLSHILPMRSCDLRPPSRFVSVVDVVVVVWFAINCARIFLDTLPATQGSGGRAGFRESGGFSAGAVARRTRRCCCCSCCCYYCCRNRIAKRARARSRTLFFFFFVCVCFVCLCDVKTWDVERRGE